MSTKVAASKTQPKITSTADADMREIEQILKEYAESSDDAVVPSDPARVVSRMLWPSPPPPTIATAEDFAHRRSPTIERTRIKK